MDSLSINFEQDANEHLDLKYDTQRQKQEKEDFETKYCLWVVSGCSGPF